MCISIYHTTSKSRNHLNNEDSLYIGDNFIIVADGMGGECNGDIASKMAVDTISHYLYEHLDSDSIDGDIKDIMFSAIKLADNDISKYVDAHPDSDGMGTTILIMIYHDGFVSLAWCGDSHCYSFGKGRLCSLTKDHSYVQELIDAKKISIEDSFSHPDNNLITRYVGGGTAVCNPEYIEHQLEGSEIIVLCSDGLSGYCHESDIKNVIISNEEQSRLPSELKELAEHHGSDDDITIVTFMLNNELPTRKHFSILNWFRRK